MSIWTSIAGLFVKPSVSPPWNEANTVNAEKPLLTVVQLQQIMPHCPADKLQSYAQCLCDAMKEGQINTINRIACFLGQIAHESNQLREWSENLNYSVKALMATWPRRFPTISAAMPYSNQPVKLANYVYAGRLGNGDEASGDGWKYRGRSPIQITGRANYRACGTAIGVDLENNQDCASAPEMGFKICVWYWNSRNLNALADKMDISGITKAINGGLLGLEERTAYTNKALAVLSV